MNRIVTVLSAAALALAAAASAAAQAQGQPPPVPAQTIRGQFNYVGGKVLEMAKDFPEAKYSYKASPEMRSFGEVIVHIASGNAFGAKIGRGEKAKWDEIDPKDFKTKADVVAMFQKAFDDANAALKDTPDDHFKETLSPWVAIIEHGAEHYGLLVAYYRLSGLVPPESRPKSK